MSRRARLEWARSLLVLATAACGGEPEVHYAPGTPEEAVVEYNRAIQDLDARRARSWVLPGDLQTRFFDTGFEISSVIRAFQDAVSAKYGEAGLEVVTEPPGAQFRRLDAFADAWHLARMKVQQQGDVALATAPDEYQIRVVRHGGKWLIDVVGSNDPEEIAGGYSTLQYSLEVIGGVLRTATAELDRTQLDLRAFDESLGRRLGEAQLEYLSKSAAGGADAPAPPPVAPNADPRVLPPPPGVSDSD